MPPRHAFGLLAAGLFALALSLCAAARPAAATPIYAIASANACDTCHIEPIGWANPEDVKDRRCSLDCRGCHVSPTGGGLRTPSGLYYGRQVLPTFGTRPGSFADPEKYRAPGAPNKGRARLFEDFEGWWPGSIPHRDIEERYGDINPEPTVRFGFDIREMIYLPTAGGDDPAIFPMQSDFHLAWNPTDQLTGYISGGLSGRRRQDNLIPPDDEEQPEDTREILDYFTVREAFVMYQDLPYNSYVRAGRFIPPFGWRLPDHTTFTRRDTDFAQFRSVFGVEGGINPNYPYASAAAFYQGLDGWPGDQNDQGVGGAIVGGWRDLAWQAGGSLHFLKRLDDGAPDDLTAGVNYGVSLYPVVLIGEIDFLRKLSNDENRESANGLISYHEANVLIYRGVYALLKYDWDDQNLSVRDDHTHRITVGATWHPYTHFQLDTQYRKNWVGNNPILNFGDSAADEVLIITRAWF